MGAGDATGALCSAPQQGTGRGVDPSDCCGECDGERVVPQKETLEVHVPRGARHGQKVVFKGKADEAPEQEAGDIVFVLDQREPHPEFKRRGSDLFMERRITLVEALTGYRGVVKHLDNRVMQICTAPGEVVRPGSFMAVENEGMPQAGNPYRSGNLYIQFEIDFPASGSMGVKTLEALRAVLPKPKVRARLRGARQAFQPGCLFVTRLAGCVALAGPPRTRGRRGAPDGARPGHRGGAQEPRAGVCGQRVRLGRRGRGRRHAAGRVRAAVSRRTLRLQPSAAVHDDVGVGLVGRQQRRMNCPESPPGHSC